MATNFVQPGENLTVTAPEAVVSGDGVIVGDLFGIASFDAETAEDVVLVTEGVFTLNKVSTDAIAQCERV